MQDFSKPGATGLTQSEGFILMPKLKEAAVLVSGQVLDIEVLKDFDTKQPDGSLKIVLATGDGFAAVKIRKEDRATLGNLDDYTLANWFVRYGAWSRNDNAETSCTFVRELNMGDLDKFASAANNKTK